jgi:YcxB-like protein
MKTTHPVVVDDDYLKEAQRLSISQITGLRLIYQTPWIWWGGRAIFVAAIIFMIDIDDAPGAILFALFLLLSFVAPRRQEKSLSKARERSPVKGALVEFSLDEQGFDSVAPNRDAHVKWPGVLRAILYPHGVLLELSPRNYSWLPDKSLTEGSPADVRQLLTDRLEERISTVGPRGR